MRVWPGAGQVSFSTPRPICKTQKGLDATLSLIQNENGLSGPDLAGLPLYQMEKPSLETLCCSGAKAVVIFWQASLAMA